MRYTDCGGEWVCYYAQPSGDQTITVSNVRGDVLLQFRKDDIQWSPHNADHCLYCDDLFSFIRERDSKRIRHEIYYDVVVDTRLWKIEEALEWNVRYTLVERACARCPICRSCCTRKYKHFLCSHGDVAHLWRPLHDKWNGRVRIEVEGYLNGARIHIALTQDEHDRELSDIMQEYDLAQ